MVGTVKLEPLEDNDNPEQILPSLETDIPIKMKFKLESPSPSSLIREGPVGISSSSESIFSEVNLPASEYLPCNACKLVFPSKNLLDDHNGDCNSESKKTKKY